MDMCNNKLYNINTTSEIKFILMENKAIVDLFSSINLPIKKKISELVVIGDHKPFPKDNFK